MALFNKDSQLQQKASNSPPEQDISSIKSSMGEQNNSQGNSFNNNNNNFNSGSNNSTNTSSQNQLPEEFVNPFSQSHSNSQPTAQPSSPQNFSSSPQQNSFESPNSLPSFQPSQSQNFSSTPQNSNAMSQDSLPSFQEPSSQQNTNSFDQNQSSMMPPQGQEQNTNSFNPQGYSNSGEYISKDEVENMIYETTEKILEQQWENLTGKVQKVIDWKSSIESEVESIKEDINTMQEAFATLEKRLISKLNNYDKSILDVGSEIKALDKVFQKVTPTLVNNVTELGKIAKDLKGVSLQNSNKNNNDSNKDN